MNICISCGMQQDHVIRLLESYTVNELPYFHYVKQEGMKLYFTCEQDDPENIYALIKCIMKNDSIGKVLLYRIEVANS